MADISEFKPRIEQPAETTEHEQEQRDTADLMREKESQAPGANMRPTADVLPFSAPTAAEFLDQKHEVETVEPMSKQGQEYWQRLANAKNEVEAVNILREVLNAGNLPPDEQIKLDAEARTRFKKSLN